MGLPISTYVTLATSISAGGILRTEYGTGLLITVDDALAAGGSGKVRRFRDLEAVEDVFPSGDVTDDAAVWFGADPPPKALFIGRWATEAVSTSLRSGDPDGVNALQISNAAFRVFNTDIVVDLSSSTTLTAAAEVIQNALSSGRVASVTVGAGGTNFGPATVVTFTGGDPARAATGEAVIDADGIGEIQITNAGTGYVSAPTVVIAAPATGTQATATVTVDSGGIETVTITNPGTGYDPASPPAITLTGGGGGSGAVLTAVVNSGSITGITITDGGSGYQSAPTVAVADADTGAAETNATLTAVLGAPEARLSGATFVLGTDNRFLLTLAGADELPRLDAPTQGTDIRAALGYDSGTTYLQGSDAETITEAVTNMVAAAVGGTPVALMLGSDAPLTLGDSDTRDDLAAFTQGSDYIYALLDTSEQALVSNDTTSHVARVFANQQSRVEPVYSMPGERPDIGLLALLSSQNLHLPASIITPHLKPLPNVMPTNITETQRAELERKRCNVYTNVGGLPSLVGGYTGRAGSWADAIWFLEFLKRTMEQDIFNAQRASRRFNTAILTDTIHGTMQTMVRSGGVMPGGRLNTATRNQVRNTTGNQDFDGVLPSGYALWVEQPNVRTDVDRENRIGRFTLWAVPGDAIHQVVGDIILSS